MKKTELKLENLYMDIPPLNAGHCDACRKDKKVAQVSGLEKDRITTYLCPVCLVKILSPVPADYKFRYCKRDRTLLCYEESDTRKLCEKCRIEKEYRKAQKYNPKLIGKTFLKKMKNIVKEANKNDIN